MKNEKIILLYFFITIFFGCSGDDSIPSTQQYSYEIKKMIMPKWKIEASGTDNIFSTLGIKSYAMDTLEVDLNGTYAKAFSLRLEVVSSFDLINRTNGKAFIPHVNYIKFINLKPNWSDNITQNIFLTERYFNSNKFFTYSESNVNLDIHPNLFFYDKFNPINIILNKTSKIGVDTETIITSYNHSINSEIYYNDIIYKVISKKILSH